MSVKGASKSSTEVSKAEDPSTVILAVKNGAKASQTLGQEVSLLCRVSELILAKTIEDDRVTISEQESSQLASLLLALLREIVLAPSFSTSYTSGGRELRDSSVNTFNERSLQTVHHLCSIYTTLLERVGDVSSHVPFLSRMFGPNFSGNRGGKQASSDYHDTSCGGSVRNPIVRARLADVYAALVSHASVQSPALMNSASALKQLVSLESGSVLGARDYDACIPIFLSLAKDSRKNKNENTPADEVASEHMQEGNDGSTQVDRTEMAGDPFTWESLVAPAMTNHSSKINSHVIVYEVLRCLSDSELVIRTAAVTALKTLVGLCAMGFLLTLEPHGIAHLTQESLCMWCLCVLLSCQLFAKVYAMPATRQKQGCFHC